ncbi:hypothetical protein B0H14DRAFT_2566586 [Mycena olivaceomarginata]|nr:hypothetical protein B0H14DRAFT_2566586 [Mycena olivaceomarginata]
MSRSSRGRNAVSVWGSCKIPRRSSLKVLVTGVCRTAGIFHGDMKYSNSEDFWDAYPVAIYSFYVGSAEHQAKLAHLMLKVLAYTYDDPSKNLTDLGLYWDLSECFPNWIEYITSFSPSVDLVPLVQMVNPDFVFFSDGRGNVERFLVRLKIIILFSGMMIAKVKSRTIYSKNVLAGI